jgi:hypothetical protein
MMLSLCVEIPVRFDCQPSAFLGHAKGIIWITPGLEYRFEVFGQPL